MKTKDPFKKSKKIISNLIDKASPLIPEYENKGVYHSICLYDLKEVEHCESLVRRLQEEAKLLKSLEGRTVESVSFEYPDKDYPSIGSWVIRLADPRNAISMDITL